jgi:hypothetical protein
MMCKTEFCNLFKVHKPSLQDCIVFFIVAGLLALTLTFRGAGWDGDSVVNIAQFEKLIHPVLFGTPDAGTAPKLMPIVLYGGFHWLTGSYEIHWITIALTAYAVAKLVRLPVENGGGPMWLALPFVSTLWIGTILSADNPALAIAFLILGFVGLMEKSPNRAIIFFLFAEFSRPGGSFLILTLVLVARAPFFLRICGRLNPVLAILTLVLGICHTALFYRLAYFDLADFTAQAISPPKPPTSGSRYNLVGVVVEFSKFVFFKFPLSHWATLLGMLGWGLHFWREPVVKNIFWLAYFFPIAILPVSAFLIGSHPYDPIYLVSAVVPVLAGMVLLFRNLPVPANFSQYAFLVWVAVGLGLAVRDGKVLKGNFETNPPEFTGGIKWLSDSRVKTLVQNARERSDRPLVLLTSCDLVTLVVDVSSYVGKFLMFSDASTGNESNRYFRDCTAPVWYKKRSEDTLLSEMPNPVTTIKPDIIYTTEDKVNLLGSTTQYASYQLKADRIIFVKKSLTCPSQPIEEIGGRLAADAQMGGKKRGCPGSP